MSEDERYRIASEVPPEEPGILSWEEMQALRSAIDAGNVIGIAMLLVRKHALAARA